MGGREKETFSSSSPSSTSISPTFGVQETLINEVGGHLEEIKKSKKEKSQ